MFGSLCARWQSEETQCEGQTRVRLGEKELRSHDAPISGVEDTTGNFGIPLTSGE